MTKQQLGKKRACLVYRSHFTYKQRQKLQQKSQGNAAYWFVLCDLVSLLLYNTQDHLPKYSTAHSELGLSTSIIS